MNQDNAQSWRSEIRSIGKYYFEVQDMIRLGFLKIEPAQLEVLKNSYKELGEINAKLRELKKELEGIEDITPIIKEIRKNRIERVRAERAIKKVEKAKAEEERQAILTERKKTKPYFLGEGVSKGLKFEGENIEKLEDNNLPVVKDLAALSEAIKLSREELLWLCYHRKTASINHYTRFKIPKKKGGFRVVSSPKSKLRIAQSWILDNILSNIETHPQATAFRPDTSIVENAQQHQEGKLIIRIDLKDFFPSIKFNRVKGLFQSFGYSEGMASILALISTDSMRLGATLAGKKYFVALTERYLPQGACTSPAISNLICRKLDNRLHKLAISKDWTYTRYADDLVFSHKEESTEIKGLLKLIEKIIEEESFIVNPEKTNVMRPHQRQSVTGIVVNNDETRISRRDIRNFRAFLHQYEQVGPDKMSEKIGKDATQYAKGYLAFIKMVNQTQAEKFTEKYKWLV